MGPYSCCPAAQHIVGCSVKLCEIELNEAECAITYPAEPEERLFSESWELDKKRT